MADKRMAGCSCRCVCHIHVKRKLACQNIAAGDNYCYGCLSENGCKRAFRANLVPVPKDAVAQTAFLKPISQDAEEAKRLRGSGGPAR